MDVLVLTRKGGSYYSKIMEARGIITTIFDKNSGLMVITYLRCMGILDRFLPVNIDCESVINIQKVNKQRDLDKNKKLIISQN